MKRSEPGLPWYYDQSFQTLEYLIKSSSGLFKEGDCCDNCCQLDKRRLVWDRTCGSFGDRSIPSPQIERYERRLLKVIEEVKE
jgi:hypothetical protein